MPEYKNIVGRKIVRVEWFKEAESEQIGPDDSVEMYHPVQKLLLDDGTYITALCNPNADGTGHVMLGDGKGHTWYISLKNPE
jgi:hypothetical protein